MRPTLTEDTLFLALTRPTLWLGVPIEAAVLIASLAVLLLLVLGNPILALGVGASLLAVSRLIVRTDYNMFRILFLWMATKARNKNRLYWGGSSYAPLSMAGVKRKGFRGA